jgi:diguanylate cyclase (GGDEF)-like protein
MPTQGKISDDPDIGRVLDGRFELTEFLAKGGMGRVYRAVQRPLDRVVAVKVLSSHGSLNEEFRQRFFLEASLCARLSHPNIVRIHDFGCDRGETYYIAMEYLSGETLKKHIRTNGPLTPLRAIRIMQQICGGLVEAHSQGMVHRDLKTSNLMLGSRAMHEDFVTIVDFGIVKDVATDSGVTMTGVLLGSPHFMSPEQINDTDVDGRSDIYSLGVILTQMLTGKLPFHRPVPVQILMDHLQTQPPSLHELNPDVEIPAALEEVVQTCLKKSRDERYTDVRHLLQAITACAYDELRKQSTPGPAARQHPQRLGAESAKEEPPANIADSLPARTTADDDCSEPVLPELDSASFSTSIHKRLVDSELKGYVGFIDFNCPFCYALHERMTTWGLVDSIEWCMVEHASHMVSGPQELHHEQTLASEVMAVHHRAPDIELMLPSARGDSTLVNRLMVHVQREHPDKLSEFRGLVYRALWQQGEDIGKAALLQDLLRQADLPAVLLQMCDRDPPEIGAWQGDWENSDFDCCIPVIAHPASGRVLIGLATPRTLAEFLLQERSRIMDSSVCYYQQKPVILICGWMSHLWQLLSDLRGTCEILQAPSARQAFEILNRKGTPDLLLIEDGHIEDQEMDGLAKLARLRSVHWALAAGDPDPAMEVRALSMGAAEYLPIGRDPTLARARLSRIMRDRFSVDRLQRESETDTLTGLISRRKLILQLEHEWERASRSGNRLSFALMNIDDFKAYNDRHGYLTGNKTLAAVAKLLRSKMQRPGDILGRFGGNEFALVLPATDETMARTIATRFQRVLSEAQLDHGAETTGEFLRLSVGVSCLQPSEATSIHQLHDLALEDLRLCRKTTANG